MQIMKRLLYFALIALITISCNENDDQWGKPTAPLVIPKTFYAQTPIPDSQTRAAWDCTAESWADTRTYAVVDPDNAAEYFQYWNEGDAISLFFTTQNLKYSLRSFKNDSLDYGIFELEGSAIKGADLTTGYYYSVYPYKESTLINNRGRISYQFPWYQHYSGDTYANGENGMVAIEHAATTDSILYFQNFCSYLQLRLATENGEVKSVRRITLISNNDDDALAGEGSVDVTEGGEPVVSMKMTASNKIVLDCGSGVELSKDINNPTRFWFVVPGDFTFSQGFSVTVAFDDYSFFQKSTTKPISIERSHIKPMAPFVPESLVATGPIRYKYHDVTIDQPYHFDTHTFFGEDGEALDVIDQIYDEETDEWVVLLSDTLRLIGGNSFSLQTPDIEYIKVDNGEVPISCDKYAFFDCTADSLMIYNDIDWIDEEAFAGSAIKDLKIYGDVTTLMKNAATGSVIENLIIDGDVVTIGVNAFSGSKHLTTIDIDGNVETIKDGAFQGCEILESVVISGNVDTIGQQAFSGCTMLNSITVNSAETIGYRAFYRCSGLTDVNIPGIKYLNMGAFRACTSLETITLESVITIDDNAFFDCSSLKTVVISPDCTMIGEGAFCNAKSLETVYCHAVKPPFIKTDNSKNSYVFENTSPALRIYIPIGSYNDYTNVNYFKNQVLADPNIKAKVNWWYQQYEYNLYEIEMPAIE